MKKLLAVVLLCATMNVYAEWVRFMDDGKGGVFYYDPSLIKVRGNLRKIWTIYDLNSTDQAGISSIRQLHEVDCSEGKVRELLVSGHSGKMAGGNVLGVNEIQGKWSYFSPETLYASLCPR
jgi:hypothetical protein